MGIYVNFMWIILADCIFGVVPAYTAAVWRVNGSKAVRDTIWQDGVGSIGDVTLGIVVLIVGRIKVIAWNYFENTVHRNITDNTLKLEFYPFVVQIIAQPWIPYALNAIEVCLNFFLIKRIFLIVLQD